MFGISKANFHQLWRLWTPSLHGLHQTVPTSPSFRNLKSFTRGLLTLIQPNKFMKLGWSLPVLTGLVRNEPICQVHQELQLSWLQTRHWDYLPDERLAQHNKARIWNQTFQSCQSLRFTRCETKWKWNDMKVENAW